MSAREQVRPDYAAFPTDGLRIDEKSGRRYALTWFTGSYLAIASMERVALHDLMVREKRAGSKILIKTPDGQTKRLEFL